MYQHDTFIQCHNNAFLVCSKLFFNYLNWFLALYCIFDHSLALSWCFRRLCTVMPTSSCKFINHFRAHDCVCLIRIIFISHLHYSVFINICIFCVSSLPDHSVLWDSSKALYHQVLISILWLSGIISWSSCYFSVSSRSLLHTEQHNCW